MKKAIWVSPYQLFSHRCRKFYRYREQNEFCVDADMEALLKSEEKLDVSLMKQCLVVLTLFSILWVNHQNEAIVLKTSFAQVNLPRIALVVASIVSWFSAGLSLMGFLAISAAKSTLIKRNYPRPQIELTALLINPTSLFHILFLSDTYFFARGKVGHTISFVFGAVILAFLFGAGAAGLYVGGSSLLAEWVLPENDFLKQLVLVGCAVLLALPPATVIMFYLPFPMYKNTVGIRWVFLSGMVLKRGLHPMTKAWLHDESEFSKRFRKASM